MKYTLLLSAMLMAFFTNAQNLEWAKTITGPGDGRATSKTSALVDHSGNIVLCGQINNEHELDLDPSANEFMVSGSGGILNAFVAKYNMEGNFLWGGAFTSEQNIFVLYKTIDKDNNLLITGDFRGEADLDPDTSEHKVTTIKDVNDAFITKLDSNGKFIWAKTFSTTKFQQVRITDIETDANGSFYISGQFMDTVDFDLGPNTKEIISEGSNDGFIAKYNVDGDLIWVHTLKGGSRVYCSDLELKSSGEIMLTGRFSGTLNFDEHEEGIDLTSKAPVYDAFFLELNIDGKLNWVKHIESEYMVTSLRLNILSNDSILVSGTFRGGTDFDPSSETLAFGDVGSGDVFCAKYTPKGEFVSVLNFGGPSGESLTETVVDPNGHIYMTGGFFGWMGLTSFGGLTTDTSLTANGNSDIYLAQFSSTGTSRFGTLGELICARKFGYETDLSGEPSDEVNGLALAKNGNVIYYGRFVGEYDMDPNEGETILIPEGVGDFVFAEFSACSDGIGPSAIAAFSSNSGVKAYPNPTNGIVHLDLPDNEKAIISITDVHGRKIDFDRTTDNTIDLSSAVNGIYFGTIQIGNTRHSFRIIKE